MYSSFFKSESFVLLILLTHCSKFYERVVPNSSKQASSFAQEETLPSVDEIPQQIETSEFLSQVFGIAPGGDTLGACEYLNTQAHSGDTRPRFRLYESVDDDPRVSLQRSSKYPEKLEVKFSGRVDIAANPFYQMGLFVESIPNRAQLMALLKGTDKDSKVLSEAEMTQLVSRFPLMAKNLKKYKPFVSAFLDNANLSTFYKNRNNLLETMVLGDFLKGVFDIPQKRKMLQGTLTQFFIHQGLPNHIEVPEIKDIPTNQKVPVEIIEEAKKKTTEILRTYSKSINLFQGENWTDFAEGMEQSVNSALKGFMSEDPKEWSCGNVLLHRGLGQIFRIQGLDQPSMIHFQGEFGVSSSLPRVPNLLVAPDSSDIRVCPRPGALFKGASRVALTEEMFLGGARGYQISKTLPNEPDCRESEAFSKFVPQPNEELVFPKVSTEFSDQYKAQLAEKFSSPERGNLSDWVGMLAGLAHYITVFNPEAHWWVDSSGNSKRPFPLFDLAKLDLEDYPQKETAGGSIPGIVHAIVAGFVKLSGAALREHVVILSPDKNVVLPDPEINDWPTDMDRIFNNVKKGPLLRFSEEPYVSGKTQFLITRASAAVSVVETFLKLHPELEVLSDWHTLIKTNSDNQSPEVVRAKEFFSMAFGGGSDLSYFFDNIYEPINSYIEEIKFGLAFMLSQMAVKNSAGEYTCSDHLQTDLFSPDKTETKVGFCDAKTHERWKNLMSLFGRHFQSPLFFHFGR